jgi:uncharacterized protein (DUF427 family)
MVEHLEEREMEVIKRRSEAGPLEFLYPEKRVRAFFADTAIADSSRVLLLLEGKHLPVYYFPMDDVRMDLLTPTKKHTHCPRKGDASYWTIEVGDRRSENAAWSYLDPIAKASEIKGYVAFYWNKLDSWFEEDDEVFVHPRDPNTRVDVLNSSRHVRVDVEGETIADTRRPRLLFETGLPTRYYIPKDDIRMGLMEPTETKTRCPYKGEASYWSVESGGKVLEDLAWSYPQPIPECPKIENLVSFFNEKVDIYVDGELKPRPKTHWS